jgi:hypothetical protein
MAADRKPAGELEGSPTYSEALTLQNRCTAFLMGFWGHTLRRDLSPVRI